MSDKEINTEPDIIENDSSDPGVIPIFDLVNSAEGIERQISGIVNKDETRKLDHPSISYPRTKKYVSEDDCGIARESSKKKDSEESIFKRIPYISRSSRIKGENNKYIREINNLEKLDPIVEIKTKMR